MRETMAVAPIMMDPWMTKPNHMRKTTAPMPSGDVDGVLRVQPDFGSNEEVGGGDEEAQKLFQEGPEGNDGDLAGQGQSGKFTPQAGARRPAADNALSRVTRTNRWAV